MLKIRPSPVNYTAGGVFPPLLSCLVITLFFPVSHAYGVQSHGGAEGLVSHQLGHFLFTLAMVVLLLRLSEFRMSGPGWCEFRGFLWFIIFWNLLTFAGHWMGEKVAAECFTRQDGHIIAFQVDSFSHLFFYLTRLDHLLLVPAFFLLLLAIQKWGHSK
ncbi:MAG: hypothetical protein KKD01_03730 [Proteobacteria bacterium]|nr:hypothetical protein [Pseudomonadota bacterium]MBU1232194.1 hypothetical protein [Pseudomonadota bacterium]MBU1453815.1 hypothetical protein [Pseudomonadota bacterium]